MMTASPITPTEPDWTKATFADHLEYRFETDDPYDLVQIVSRACPITPRAASSLHSRVTCRALSSLACGRWVGGGVGDGGYRHVGVNWYVPDGDLGAPRLRACIQSKDVGTVVQGGNRFLVFYAANAWDVFRSDLGGLEARWHDVLAAHTGQTIPDLQHLCMLRGGLARDIKGLPGVFARLVQDDDDLPQLWYRLEAVMEEVAAPAMTYEEAERLLNGDDNAVYNFLIDVLRRGPVLERYRSAYEQAIDDIGVRWAKLISRSVLPL